MRRGRPVSVIVRTKDRPILLRKALKSIFAQTYRPVEAVVVNDGGGDLDTGEIREILGDIDLRYLRLDKSLGRARAGNLGLDSARGEYVGFLDDDDLFYPDHLSILVDVLEQYDYQAAYADAEISYRDFDARKTRMAEIEKRLFASRDFSYEELLIDNYIPIICLLFRAETLKRYKGFDENLEVYEDWDLLIRIGERYPFYHVPKTTAEYVQWSRDLQVAQSPVFFDKAAACHNDLIVKHKDKYSPGIIRSLVQSRRLLRDLERDSGQKELVMRERDDLAAKLESLNDHARRLEEELALRDASVLGLESAAREKDERIAGYMDTVNSLKTHTQEVELKLQEKESCMAALEGAADACRSRAQEAERLLQEKEMLLQEQNQAVHSCQKHIADLEERLKESTLENKAAVAGLEEQIRQKNFYISRVEAAKANIDRTLRDREAALTRIYGSNGWKGLQLYYRLRDRLLPPGTMRRSVVKSLAGSLRKGVQGISSEGTASGGDALTDPSPCGVLPSPHHLDQSPCYSGSGCQDSGGRTETESGADGRDAMPTAKKEVLVAGVYLANQENAIRHIVSDLNGSKDYSVSQKWIALFGDAPSAEVKAVTVALQEKPEPKFVLLNRILAREELDRFEYILFCDDDIRLGSGFLDMFLGLQGKYNFSLAQPARTHNSYIDHPFVEQFDGLKARRTRFIEIGPVVSVRRDAFQVILPFDESAHMGWGYDFVWPCLMEKMGMRMGIIDATPVEHSMRKPVLNYNYDEANKSMQNYLARSPHLSKEEAFRILESYA